MMLIICSIGLFSFFVMFGTCEMFAERSEWLSRHLEKIEAITQKSELFRKYGILTLHTFYPGTWGQALWMHDDCVAVQMAGSTGSYNTLCSMASCDSYYPADINRNLGSFSINRRNPGRI